MSRCLNQNYEISFAAVVWIDGWILNPRNIFFPIIMYGRLRRMRTIRRDSRMMGETRNVVLELNLWQFEHGSNIWSFNKNLMYWYHTRTFFVGAITKKNVFNIRWKLWK